MTLARNLSSDLPARKGQIDRAVMERQVERLGHGDR